LKYKYSLDPIQRALSKQELQTHLHARSGFYFFLQRSSFKMMFQHLIALAFIGLAAAHPLGEADIVARDGLSSTSNSLKEGSCKDVTLIFARGSTEVGNMVRIPANPRKQTKLTLRNA
jgi:hypothetical protein